MRNYWMLATVIFVVLLILTDGGAIGQANAPGTYTITFHEVGLPPGTMWSISVNGNTETSNNSTIVFLEQNGTYTFYADPISGYRPQPSSFSFTVNGQNISYYTFVWSPVLYQVTFVESGLPSGTLWSATIGNQTNSSSTSTIVFNMQNGTYSYFVPSVNGVNSSIPNGSLTVKGSAVRVLLRFVVVVQFTFIEQGLPSGAHWSVWINGTYHNSSSTFISVKLPNGTYQYAVVLPPGYGASPAGGKVGWNDSLVIVNTTSPIGYYVVIAILVVVIALIPILYFRRMKRIKSERSTEKNNEKKN
ncbi:MAG: hypothetical protein QXU18_11185 [Thermoplasmatales archaeon]